MPRTKQLDQNRIVPPVIITCICLLVGAIGGLITAPAIDGWYSTLVKPSFTPPGWVFAPAWTVLYIMMGIAAGLVWNQGIKKIRVKAALQAFTVQLCLNFIWSVIFFRLRHPVAAFAEIIVLWVLIYYTYVQFKRINPVAGQMLIPYLFWVSFASILNLSIALQN